jgi:peptidoglycan glycosyltransferase
MNVTIRRLTSLFIILFLLISGVAAYIQINNHAFLNGPVLAAGPLDPRVCDAPDDQAWRGTIYDRNGVKLAYSVQDPTADCGYRRVYTDPTLSPVIGYFSYKYGASGIEAAFNDYLAGTGVGASPNDALNKILHRQRHGNDLYLTIDDKLQQQVAALYESRAVVYGAPNCETAGTTPPPGSIIVEDPNTGQILAMYSSPSFDANKITLNAQGEPNYPGYWESLNANQFDPLLNHATQGLTDPGSTFKTLTMLAGLDSGQYSLNTPFDYNSATTLTVNGETIRWEDYFNGTWNGVLTQNNFPITLQQGFAYSDNTMFARVAVQIGADTWLKYARAFGLKTPGYQAPVKPVPFDEVSAQSGAYNQFTSGQPTQFTSNPNLLAESGFGQGQLFITPLTMTEIVSTIASNGYLYEPHMVSQIVPYGESRDSVLPGGDGLIGDRVAYGGGPIIEPQTAAAMRAAMWSVVDYGTANYGLSSPETGVQLRDTGTHEGGKTGTGQGVNTNPETWWISLAPDDQAPGGGAAKYVVTVHKEQSREGACQVFVADDIYQDLGV